MDAVLGIPCGDTANAVAAVVKILQIGCNFDGRLLFLKGRNNPLPLMIGIATQPKHLVDLVLGKRKSRGCSYILCFVNIIDLFFFGEEQV